jgi:hypothetical protein
VRVYAIKTIAQPCVKIGYAQNPSKRLADLQGGCPHHLALMGVRATAAPREDERELHRRFKKYRIRDNGEWFYWTEEIKAEVLLWRKRYAEEQIISVAPESFIWAEQARELLAESYEKLSAKWHETARLMVGLYEVSQLGATMLERANRAISDALCSTARESWRMERLQDAASYTGSDALKKWAQVSGLPMVNPDLREWCGDACRGDIDTARVVSEDYWKTVEGFQEIREEWLCKKRAINSNDP